MALLPSQRCELYFLGGLGPSQRQLLSCVLLIWMGFSFSCSGERSKLEWMNPKDIHPQTDSHSRLSEQQVTRVRRIQSALFEVDPSSSEKWIDDFEKDQDPEREIRRWESMVDAYRSYCAANPKLSVEGKQEVLQILLARSGTDDERDVFGHVHLIVLTEQDAWDVMRSYKGSAAPIEVERKP